METNPFRAQRLAQEQEAAGEAPPSATPDTGPEGPVAGPDTGRDRGGVRAWVEGRVTGQVWYYRAALLLILFWMYSGYPGDPLHTTIFDGISLGFHEMGHAAFSWTGSRLLTVAGGTIFELGIPLLAGVYLLLKQRDPFGATVCVFWLGTALWHTAAYVGDARAQVLPLVSPFGPVDSDSHDWTYMLMRFGMLSRDWEIAGYFRLAARFAMLGSLLGGGWIVWVMRRVHTSPTGGTAAQLVDQAEADRLAARVRGEKVSRPTDRKRRKHMSEEERLKEFLDGQ